MMPGENLPPVREHIRYVVGEGGHATIMCKTYDAGAADRAASAYARTILHIKSPKVTVSSGAAEVEVAPIYSTWRKTVTRRRVKEMQCKHIDDASMIRAVDSLSGHDRRWTFTSAIAELYPDVPFKVVAAKLSRLMIRGYLEGCDCGCRGDWYLTAKGSELISP